MGAMETVLMFISTFSVVLSSHLPVKDQTSVFILSSPAVLPATWSVIFTLQHCLPVQPQF